MRNTVKTVLERLFLSKTAMPLCYEPKGGTIASVSEHERANEGSYNNESHGFARPPHHRLRRALATKKTESTKLSVFYSIFGYFSVRYSVFSIATTVSSTTVSTSSSASDTISLPASGSNSTPLRFASNFLKSFEKKNPIAIITANTII